MFISMEPLMKFGCITEHYLTQRLKQYTTQQNNFYNRALSDSEIKALYEATK
jgi:hypothetical protein